MAGTGRPERGVAGAMPLADDVDQPPPSRRSGSARTVAVGLALVALVIGGVVAAVLLRSDPAPLAGTAGLAEPVPFAERTVSAAAAPLPARTLAAFGDGEPIDLTAYRGRPLVVNFWATWCAPCVKEMPALQQVAAEVEGRVGFLGVNVQDAPVNATTFADQLGISYALATDPRGAFWKEVGGFGMPTTLLVDRKGMVVYRHTGALDAEELRGLVRRRLGVRLRGRQ